MLETKGLYNRDRHVHMLRNGVQALWLMCFQQPEFNS